MTPEDFAELYIQPEYRRFFLNSFNNAQVEPLDVLHLPDHYDLSLLMRFCKRDWTYFLTPKAGPELVIPVDFNEVPITTKINELIYPYKSFFVKGHIDLEEGDLYGKSFRTLKGNVNGYLVRVSMSPDTYISDSNETIRISTWCLLCTKQILVEEDEWNDI